MTIKEMMRRARKWFWPREKMQVEKRQTRYTYVDGPMVYLGQQIIKAMEDAGYPAMIFESIRTPERQDQLRKDGKSNAGQWQSPHQYWEAVDIVHPSLYWSVSKDYWMALRAAVEVVEAKFNVKLVQGGRDWGWDEAHVQLADWRKAKRKHDERLLENGEKRRPPNEAERAERFLLVLPQVWQGRPQ